MPGAIELYERLKGKLGEEEARDLIAYINESGKAGLATKEDLAELKALTQRELAESRVATQRELAALRSELVEKIAELRAATQRELAESRVATQRELAALRSELVEKIASVRSELIRWMFIFWIGQIGAILGILFAFFRRS